jgi:hypothetical protein
MSPSCCGAKCRAVDSCLLNEYVNVFVAKIEEMKNLEWLIQAMLMGDKERLPACYENSGVRLVLRQVIELAEEVIDVFRRDFIEAIEDVQARGRHAIDILCSQHRIRALLPNQRSEIATIRRELNRYRNEAILGGQVNCPTGDFRLAGSGLSNNDGAPVMKDVLKPGLTVSATRTSAKLYG